MTARPIGSGVAALRRLELLVTRRLDGLLAGDHLGLLPGPGSELAEGRPYEPGDDVRLIDWNLTARMAEPHARTTEADRELGTWVVVDTSASLDFGTADCEKRDLAVAATAAVGFLTVRGGNRFGAVVTGGPEPLVLPPRSGSGAVHAVLRAVTAAPRREDVPGPRASVAAGLETLSRAHQRRGLVVVVSDFLEAGWERPLRRTGLRHQLLAAVVGDPRERQLPAVGLLTLVDPETGRRVEVQTSSPKLRARYEQAAAEQAHRRTVALRSTGAAVLELSTDRDWLLDVVRFVATSRRHRAGYTLGVTR